MTGKCQNGNLSCKIVDEHPQNSLSIKPCSSERTLPTSGLCVLWELFLFRHAPNGSAAAQVLVRSGSDWCWQEHNRAQLWIGVGHSSLVFLQTHKFPFRDVFHGGSEQQILIDQIHILTRQALQIHHLRQDKCLVDEHILVENMNKHYQRASQEHFLDPSLS